MCVTDKETKSSDDAPSQQPGLSASALLREHEKAMKTTKDKKHSQETSSDTSTDGCRLTNTQSVSASTVTDRIERSSSDVVRYSSLESDRVRDRAVMKRQLSHQHDSSCEQAEQEPHESLKHVVKPKYQLPELGRGLSVSDSGFVDLDDIPCSSTQSSVSDSTKVS